MPRQSLVPRDEAIRALDKYIDQFKNGTPPWSSNVWDDLAEECNGAWSRNCWWTNVTKNRRSILSQSRHDRGIEHVDTVKTNQKDTSPGYESDISFHGSESEGGEDESWFKLILTQEQWNSIKPVHSSTDDGEKTKIRTLRAGVWTNDIADEFYKQYGLPCAYSFSRCEINISSGKTSYLKIKGYCRSKKCKNSFYGYLYNQPSSIDEQIIIHVRTRNTSREVHDDVRRFLNGEKRKEFGKQSHNEGTSNMLKRLRRENMERGDTEGPNFPKANVLRHAQHEHVNRELGMNKTDDDLIQKIYQLQFEKPFKGSINAVGYNPLYVFYGLPLQITLYEDYIKIMKEWSTICIDGTGSLVRKLLRDMGLRSGHIFLHCIVIHFDKKIVSVFQMLSESQETETFAYWLKRWLGLVRVKPRQCITDCSRALLAGSSKAFNNMTIKDYLDVYFSFLRKGDLSVLKGISTFLRVDVAHLIHFICKWECTRAIQRCQVRDFFIRCVALMVDCQRLSEFNEIFTLTCAVGLNSHDDTVLNLSSVMTVRQAREILEAFMSKRNVDIEKYLEAANVEEEDAISSEASEDCPSNIKVHIKELLTKAKSEIHTGSELNSFYVPKFIQKFIGIANEFILWTAVGVPFFVGHASSSYNEKNFQDLKTKVLSRYSKRINLEKFMRIHMRDLIGGSKDVSSKLTTFTVQGKTLPRTIWKTNCRKGTAKIADERISNKAVGTITMSSPHDHPHELSGSIVDDPDLLSREDWRGKTEPGIFDPPPRDDDSERVRGVPMNHEQREQKNHSLDDHNYSFAQKADESDDSRDYSGERIGYLCNDCDQFISLKNFSRHICR